MITNVVMTPAAEAAAQRYGLMIEGWRAIFRNALSVQDFGTERAMNRARDEVYAIARTYLHSEGNIILERMTAVASEARRDALSSLGSSASLELPVDASELVSATQQYLLNEIAIQIERDIAMFTMALRQAVLQIRLVAQVNGIGQQMAQLQYQAGNSQELHFFYHDRANKRWPSRKFVRAIWRQSLLSVFNEVMLLTLADHGFDHAEVQHLHEKAGVHGLKVAMGMSASLPSYGEIRIDVFHPNAEAILTVPGSVQ